MPAQAFAVGESMSLYRAGLKLALFLPLGVAMPLFSDCQKSPLALLTRGPKDATFVPLLSAVRFHRCELRYQSTLTG